MRPALIASLLLAAACASERTSVEQEAFSTCAKATSVVAPAPARVSFELDVAPIFHRSCTFSACHGAGADPHGVGLLGDPAEVRARLVGVQAAGATMPYVDPGKPDESFLLRKIEGTFCGLEDRCRSGDCGDPMPRDSTPLGPKEQAAIRGWIAQGAQL